ncbi:MAG: HD domain-containing protein [Candidatus Micrarchaeia archaeon]
MKSKKKIKVKIIKPTEGPFKNLEPQTDNQLKGLLEELLSHFRIYNKTNLWKIERAYKFANERHKGQLRKDGKTPYFMHVWKVAFEVSKRGYNSKVIEASLLHDVIEDCNIHLKEIRKIFGTEVARIVDLLSKPRLTDGKWRFANDRRYYLTDEYTSEKYEERAEVYYGRLLSSKNMDAIMIKLFDSVVNLEDIRNLEPEKITRNIERMIKYVLWLSPAILNRKDCKKIVETLKEWGYNIPREMLPKKPTEKVVILPSREDIDIEFFRKMPQLTLKNITLYWSDGKKIFEIGFPPKMVDNSLKIRGLLDDEFGGCAIYPSQSLVAEGIGAHEIIFAIEKKGLSFEEILAKCESFFEKLASKK